MNGGVVLGIAIVVALSFASAVMLRLLLSSPSIIGWVGDKGVPALRRRLRRRRMELPTSRPIEEIAHNIRRLGGGYHGGHPGRSWVKSEALRRAYDEALDEGCRALDISTDLLDLEPGTERDAERMRVEHLLATAGLVMRHRPAA
ncbi:hypothetical protein ISU07_21360 [Nocardioides islandensis]|jgi:hypothetical protein|uniref:Uncharacterized protein n=1 Tax=Nocardioides islandensis TaxID=433663 RepID=A0A930YG74_9ACTN|nr:hypothetical protein [Nocardioides islandensis]MBF4765687.1 hypothetical protein [Nocardioides islandensis]